MDNSRAAVRQQKTHTLICPVDVKSVWFKNVAETHLKSCFVIQ